MDAAEVTLCGSGWFPVRETVRNGEVAECAFGKYSPLHCRLRMRIAERPLWGRKRKAAGKGLSEPFDIDWMVYTLDVHLVPTRARTDSNSWAIPVVIPRVERRLSPDLPITERVHLAVLQTVK